MNMKISSFVSLGVLVLALAGCNSGLMQHDAMWADDVADQQEAGRSNRRIPGPTELPPGLGEDLPQSPAPAAIMETPASPDQRHATNN